MSRLQQFFTDDDGRVRPIRNPGLGGVLGLAVADTLVREATKEGFHKRLKPHLRKVGINPHWGSTPAFNRLAQRIYRNELKAGRSPAHAEQIARARAGEIATIRREKRGNVMHHPSTHSNPQGIGKFLLAVLASVFAVDLLQRSARPPAGKGG